MEQYLREEGIDQTGFNEEIHESLEKLKLTSADMEPPESNSSNVFECNICLDAVQDPVVTFCGHLYCWSCIYRWMNYHIENQTPRCPVCKTEVSQKTLVPLYGRGQTSDPLIHKDHNVLVPHRPTNPQCNNPRYAQPSELGRHIRIASPVFGIGGGSERLAHPMIWMFGEMIYTRMFGNSETTMLRNYPNSYHLAGSNSPRLRRLMMETDTSLSRVCFFLCCCVILCLVLF